MLSGVRLLIFSPFRHVNQVIYLLTTGARESAYKNIKTITECLADELINAARNHSSGCLACVQRNKEQMEKGSDAQSSCTKPDMEAESA